MPFCNVGNSDYYYEIQGEGRPLVLISGYGCDHSYWQFVCPELSKHYQLVLFDNRGTGQTTDDGGELTSTNMAADIIVLLQKLGIKKAHVAGQSMGGTIAQMIAINHGDQVDKICILNSTARWRASMVLAFKLYVRLIEQAKIEEALDLLFSLVLGDEFLRDPEKVAWYTKLIENAPYPQSIADAKRHLYALVEHDARDLLVKIKNPTLIMASIEDAIALECDAHLLNDKISSGTLEFIRGGHSSCNERPQVVVDCLLKFLA